MSFSRKEKAIKLRRLGYSYKMIGLKLQLSKSTLSNWLKNILYKPNEETLRRVGKAKLKSAKSKSRQKIANIRQMKSIARREIGKISLRDLWMLGIGLYMGEGTKLHEEIKFSNSNPQIVRLMMIWFRNICGAKNNNLSASIHLYPDNDEAKAKKYWAKITGLPIKQFQKTHIDRRTNKSPRRRRKLPHGTIHIKVTSRGIKKLGRSLHRRIIGWIEASLSQTTTRV